MPLDELQRHTDRIYRLEHLSLWSFCQWLCLWIISNWKLQGIVDFYLFSCQTCRTSLLWPPVFLGHDWLRVFLSRFVVICTLGRDICYLFVACQLQRTVRVIFEKWTPLSHEVMVNSEWMFHQMYPTCSCIAHTWFENGGSHQKFWKEEFELDS